MEHKRLKQFPNYEIWEDGTEEPIEKQRISVTTTQRSPL